jgi:hypothetical protein
VVLSQEGMVPTLASCLHSSPLAPWQEEGPAQGSYEAAAKTAYRNSDSVGAAGGRASGGRHDAGSYAAAAPDGVQGGAGDGRSFVGTATLMDW